ncbi:MAG: quinone-dependent dihydroorotate dehydrogenase [Nitrosomonadales bacterium]|nr:quinone-dependent dihydroorotate dehydrogenase [Nitrosomonadales bacterium]
MYPLLRPLIFSLDAETAHHAALDALQASHLLGLSSWCGKRPAANPRTVMGLTFPNPVGLAAGLDKDGACIDALAALGFGFIEVGTVTPRPQPGNPRPRLFRLPEAQAIINRMGFNNCGVDALIANVQRSKYCGNSIRTGIPGQPGIPDQPGILGINIGKNADTPMERAADDYLICLRKVYPHAGYVAVNISSPNTRNLRQLQGASELDALLSQLKAEQESLAGLHGKYVPLALKIAPDLDGEQIRQIAALLVRHRMDGVIATNTTLSREGVEHLPQHAEAGGLSGAPVRGKSTAVIRELAAALDGALPIIGVGGILSGADAVEKIRAGASLVQIYSGMIYRGPELVKECAEAIRAAG